MLLLVIYSAAAWFSLFWINGILSFQLAPGWLENRYVWSGFFNASFWPSLLYRTVASMAIAALAACVLINIESPFDREARRELISRVSLFLAPMILMPFLGIWFLASMPPDSRSWVLGGSVTMTMFMGIGVGASLLIGAYALGAFWYRRLYINGFTAALLCAIAFAATAGGEFVREGVRKPYSICQVLYSNSLRQDELERLRKSGSAAADPYRLHDGVSYPSDQLRDGALVYRFQCSVCHTYQGRKRLAGAHRNVESRSETVEYLAIAGNQAIHASVCGNGRRSGGTGAAPDVAARGDAAPVAPLARSRDDREDPGLARRGRHHARRRAHGAQRQSRRGRANSF